MRAQDRSGGMAWLDWVDNHAPASPRHRLLLINLSSSSSPGLLLWSGHGGEETRDPMRVATKVSPAPYHGGAIKRPVRSFFYHDHGHKTERQLYYYCVVLLLLLLPPSLLLLQSLLLTSPGAVDSLWCR